MTTPAAAVPDLMAIKGRQQRTWASGDYAAVAALIVPWPRASAMPRTSRPAGACST